MDHIEIAISTLGARIADAVKLASKLTPSFDVLVVHQIPDGNDYNAMQLVSAYGIEPERFRYFAYEEIGLSKSRNRALHLARREYLWLLDDDVDVDLAACENFFSGERFRLSDITTIAVRKDRQHQGQKYPCKARRHNLITILSVGTIEIIVNVDAHRQRKCQFPEDMGAGTDHPLGEEPVFLSCCIHNGLTVSYEPAYLVSHPHESSGDRFLEPAHCRARGLAFYRIYGRPAGYLLLILFYLKHTPRCLGDYGTAALLNGVWKSLSAVRISSGA